MEKERHTCTHKERAAFISHPTATSDAGGTAPPAVSRTSTMHLSLVPSSVAGWGRDAANLFTYFTCAVLIFPPFKPCLLPILSLPPFLLRLASSCQGRSKSLCRDCQIKRNRSCKLSAFSYSNSRTAQHTHTPRTDWTHSLMSSPQPRNGIACSFTILR